MDKAKKKPTEAEEQKPEQPKERLVQIFDVHGSPVRDANGNEVFARRNRADDDL